MPLLSTKPRSKRAKVSTDKEETASIHERVATGRYTTVQEFLSDIEKASSTVIEQSKTRSSTDQTDGSPLTETVNRIAAFKKVLNSLVRQAHVSQNNVKTEAPEGDRQTPAMSTPSHAESRTDSTVLTLFGNPSNPKQLFSSLQKSVKVPLSSESPEAAQYVEVQAPLRDVVLPNGITTTKVTPTNLETETKQPKRTFREVFAPRSGLPQLEPPRRARSSSRSTWIDTFDAMTNYKSFPGERNNYCLAPLPSGQWLQYGGVTSSPSYWNRKQKQQDENDAVYRPYEEPSLAREESPSLLQGVYSSFAPSFDSSGAVVQADSKDLVWWGKRGTKRLETLLSIPYEGQETEVTPTEQPGNIGELDEQTLDEMVKSFKSEDFADNVTSSSEEEKKENEETKELNALLRDVSELLETLSSYQKVRNLDISAQGQDTSSEQSDPNTPSVPERTVYETLKSSLAALVANLPPYAVAKLDGDQLAELNISQKVLIENQDYHGTMQKDDYSLQQERLAALASNVGSTNRTSTPTAAPVGRPRTMQGYNRVVAPTAQGYATPQAYYGARQPSTPGGYAPAQYAGARPPSTPSQRPGYLPQYSQTGTPQNVSQIPRQGSNGYPITAQQAAAQASPQPYTPRAPQPGAYNAPYASSRTASPQKPAQYNTPQPRTSYVAPQQQQQQRYPPQQQQYASTPQSSGYSNSAAVVTYARSAAEQAALMDRNKAQLAQQQQHQQSTTPGAASASGSQDRSMTPGSKPNGTPVPS